MLLSGAEIIIEALREQKTDYIFGYPGGTVSGVYDALFRRGKTGNTGGLTHILTAHEQGAAHAADGYARATGRTGVCLVTSGPGATNLVTGIATAYMDSIPLVCITINVARSSLGKDSFQEVDIAGVTMPVTKHNFIVKDVRVLADTLRRAFIIAASGRPGPVLVDITKDVTEAEAEFEPIGAFVKLPASEPTEEELDETIKYLKKAKKPLLLLGGGAVLSDAQAQVRILLEKLSMPVADTLMGKGVCPGKDRHYIGMAGIHGTYAANYAISEADLILAVGTRFSERVTGNRDDFAADANIIQIDVDRAELNKNVKIKLGLAGDAKIVLRAINERLKKEKAKEFEAWFERIKTAAAAADAAAQRQGLSGAGRLSGLEIVRAVEKLTGGEALVTTEVGLNQMWAAGNFRFRHPGQLITSGGLGTMGFGLSAAIGAKLGCPGRTVVNFAGDGCFRMNMNELITAVAYRLPVIEIIFDNGTLGMVKQIQSFEYDNRFSETVFKQKVNYRAVAEALGAKGADVTCMEEFEKSFAEAAESELPYVIVCKISGDEYNPPKLG